MSLQSNLQYLIYEYISYCFDELGILPSEDDIYTRFQLHFDNGVPFEVAEEEISRFVGIHNLKDIEIRWEGEINGVNFGRVKANSKVPQQTTR